MCKLTDIFIGFAPNVSGMTAVGPWALYLSLYRYYSMGPSLAFPDAKNNFIYTYTQFSQNLISKSEIYLSAVKLKESNVEPLNMKYGV